MRKKVKIKRADRIKKMKNQHKYALELIGLGGCFAKEITARQTTLTKH